ncbi:head-tail connector protein [Mesorhizobium yinganensis]|uniref:head-tail connector protein n=1 Tax=Mesorhizobium yinganensis TaxID=3157707 RepID=UPI0032B70B09
MWYPTKVTTAPSVEPITLDDVRRHCSVDEADGFDTELTRLIKAARAHVEKYCSARFAEQTIEAKCDCFADLPRLPEAPVKSLTSIAYLDVDGVVQTVANTVYEERFDGYDAAIVLKPGQHWPAIQCGSRITITAVVGGDPVDPAVAQAMIMHVANTFLQREPVAVEGRTSFDDLLCNHRR